MDSAPNPVGVWELSSPVDIRRPSGGEAGAESDARESPGAAIPVNDVVESSDDSTALRRANPSYSSSSATSQPTMLKHKLGYLGIFFAFSCFFPFASVLLSAKRFTPSQVGIITSLNPLATLILCPFLAVLADKRGWQVPIMTLGLALATVSVSVMCVSETPWIVAAASTCFYLTQAPIVVFYDEHVTTALGENKSAYGAVRCYGAYGWAVGASLASYLFGVWGWIVIPFLWLIGQSLFGFCLLSTQQRERQLTTRRYGEVAEYVIKRPRVVLFFVAVSFSGVGSAFITIYLFLFLQQLGAPDTLLGATIFFTVCVEIPLFRAAPWLHRTFSDRALFTVSCVAWTVRVLGYSLLENPWVVLVLEPLHGFTFGCMWLAAIHFVSHAFPSDLSNTGIAMVSAACWGLGPLIGTVAGGFIYESYGPRLMFQYSGVAMLFVAGGFYLLDAHLEKSAAGDVQDNRVD